MGLIPVLFFCVRYENICELKNVIISCLDEKQLTKEKSVAFLLLYNYLFTLL